jgi:chromosome segregation ATPase
LENSVASSYEKEKQAIKLWQEGKEKLEAKEKEVEKLRNRVEDLQSDLRKVDGQLREARSETSKASALKEELEESKKREDDLYNETRLLREENLKEIEKYEGLENSVKKLSRDVERLQKERDQARADRDDSVRDLGKMRAEVDELEAQLKQSLIELEEAKAGTDAMSELLGRSGKMVVGSREELGKMKGYLEDLAKDYESFGETYKALNASYENAVSGVDELCLEISNLVIRK